MEQPEIPVHRLRKQGELFSFFKHPSDYYKNFKNVFGDFFDNCLTNLAILSGKKEVTEWVLIHDKGAYTKSLRDELTEELNRINQNPYGENSIDPSLSNLKKRSRAQDLRAINKISINDNKGRLADIVVKSTGKIKGIKEKDREDLVAQFLTLRGLYDLFEGIDREIKDDWAGFVRPIKTYGVISIRNRRNRDEVQEYLLMDYGGQRFNDDNFFNPEEHPKLKDFILKYLGQIEENFKTVDENGKEKWSIESLSQALEKRYGVKIDLTGRDILFLEKNGKKEYKIIDIKPDELHKSES